MSGATATAGANKQRLAHYQAKTGSFNASTPAQLKSILLKPASLPKRKPTLDDLNDRVRECLDSG
jgi:hypothetical protein